MSEGQVQTFFLPANSSSKTSSEMSYCPWLAIHVMLPRAPGGTMTLWSMRVFSGTTE